MDALDLDFLFEIVYLNHGFLQENICQAVHDAEFLFKIYPAVF